MRDVQFISLNGEEELVIAADCSGAIGEKVDDLVHAPSHITAYFTMRVALMELLAVGARLLSVTVHNLTDEKAWKRYQIGVEQALNEADLLQVSYGGSSETNFSMQQSALGITLTGIVRTSEKKIERTPKDASIAVIGCPLVGEEVLTKKEKIAPLHLFLQILQQDYVYEVWPVGSKGIGYECDQLYADNKFISPSLEANLNLHKSAGPSTCFLVTYREQSEDQLKEIAQQYFYPLNKKS